MSFHCSHYFINPMSKTMFKMANTYCYLLTLYCYIKYSKYIDIIKINIILSTSTSIKVSNVLGPNPGCQ